MAGENKRTGLLRLVGQDAIPDASYDTASTPLPDNGAARLWDQARSGFAEVGATVSHTLDQAAAAEGKVAGRLAGLDPEFRPTHANTIRGRAFDEAGMQVAETSMKTAMAADMARAHDLYRNDPVKLQGELDGIRRAYLAKALPETLPSIQLEADHARFSYMRDASRIQIQQTEHGQIGAFQEETAGAIKRMHQRAYQLGLDPQADAIMAADLDQLRGSLARKGVNGLPLATPEQAQKIIEHAKESISNARVLGGFDRLGSMAEKEQFISDLDGKFQRGEGLAKVYTLDQYESLKRHLRSEMHASRAHDSVLGEGLKSDIASIDGRAKQGIMVSPDEIAQLRTRAIAAGHGDKLASIDQAERTARVLWDLRRYAPEDIESYAASEKARINAAAAHGNGVAGGPDYRSQQGPASVRFNNPGAMYPGPSASRFGAVGVETIGGGHKIAVFPDAVSGAAAQFDLLASSYTGQSVRQAISKWSGGNDVSGYLATLQREAGISPDHVLTREDMKNPAVAIPLAKAMSVQEAGRAYPLDDAQWSQAHAMALKGSREGMLAAKTDFALGRDEAKHVAAIEGLAAHARSEIARDQLGWAAQTGLVPVAPLDLADQASIRARITAAEVAGRAYGRDAVYLRPEEKRSLALAIHNGGPEALNALGALSGGFGDRMGKVAAELQKDGHAPVTAALAGLVAEVGPNEKGVRDAIDGLAILKQKDHEHLAPKGTDTRGVVVDTLGSSLSRLGKDEGAVVALANAIYVQRAIQSGNKGVFDKGLYEQALRDAVGERTLSGYKYGGVVSQGGWMPWGIGTNNIILPPSLKQGSWRQAVDNITADDLKAVGAGNPIGDDGKPVSLDRIKRATLLQAGPGQYAIATGDASRPGQEGIVWADRKGNPLLLDLNALAPILAKRRPDLFHGGK